MFYEITRCVALLAIMSGFIIGGASAGRILYLRSRLTRYKKCFESEALFKRREHAELAHSWWKTFLVKGVLVCSVIAALAAYPHLH